MAHEQTKRDGHAGDDADYTEQCRLAFIAAAESCGSTAIAEETAILSAIDAASAPDYVLRVRNGGEPTWLYWDWLRGQTEQAQAEHDREIAAGHEWHQ